MKLRDWTYIHQASWINKNTIKHLDKEVVNKFSEFECRKQLEEKRGELLKDSEDYGWDAYLEEFHNTTFTHRFIYTFVELEDGTLVGLNENPSRGWSFPTAKWKHNE